LPEKVEIFQKFTWKKSKFFKNEPGKIAIFCEIAWRDQNFLEICLEKS